MFGLTDHPVHFSLSKPARWKISDRLSPLFTTCSTQGCSDRPIGCGFGAACSEVVLDSGCVVTNHMSLFREDHPGRFREKVRCG